MSIQKLERVMWRIRSENPEKTYINWSQLRIATDKEIGTDIRTYHTTKKALIRQGWIKTRKNKFEITDKDLT